MENTKTLENISKKEKGLAKALIDILIVPGGATATLVNRNNKFIEKEEQSIKGKIGNRISYATFDLVDGIKVLGETYLLFEGLDYLKKVFY